MAAFASFHIGEKLQLWDWESSGVKPFDKISKTSKKSIEFDFQIIRILNNKIFHEIGFDHLSFSQMEFSSFKALLQEKKKHNMIIDAFEKLNNIRNLLKSGQNPNKFQHIIWEANIKILWHEQSQVVQPLFDRLTTVFSGAMTLYASFDYKINHHQTKWYSKSKFLFFMLFKGFHLVKKNYFIPDVTNIKHRWFWIYNDIVKKWKKVEANKDYINTEINSLAKLEKRLLSI